MARRREGLLDVVMELPWWFGVGPAVLVYVFLRYAAPEIVPSNRPIYAAARAASQLAWLFAIPFLVAGMVSAGRQLYRRELFNSQTSLESVRALSWQQFEHLVGEAFRRQGYVVEERGGSAPDGGVDLDLWNSGKKTVVQCKRWQSKQVGVNLVRELYGVMTAERADEAIFVSSGDYTDDACRFADGKPIRMINGKVLLKMIHAVQPARPRSEESVPMCPKCARQMVVRTARSGPRAGQGFWGCSAFPQCRGTRPLS